MNITISYWEVESCKKSEERERMNTNKSTADNTHTHVNIRMRSIQYEYWEYVNDRYFSNLFTLLENVFSMIFSEFISMTHWKQGVTDMFDSNALKMVVPSDRLFYTFENKFTNGLLRLCQVLRKFQNEQTEKHHDIIPNVDSIMLRYATIVSVDLNRKRYRG